MALSWSARRQLIVISIAVAALLMLAAFPVAVFLTQPETCSDGKQNQDETGVDCGGSCSAICEADVRSITVRWARAFPAGENTYDIAALVQNPNGGVGTDALAYTFELFDEENVFITQITGVTHVGAGEEFVVLESSIVPGSGRRQPARVFVDFDEQSAGWERMQTGSRNITLVRTEYEARDPNPRLRATLANNSLETFENVDVSAVALDADDNALGVSKTLIQSMPKGGTRIATFLFPKPFSEAPAQFEVYPHPVGNP